MSDAVQITGLKQFTKALKDIDRELPKTMRIANNAVASIVVEAAAPRVPVRSGKARRSIKARSTRNEARVSAGGKRVPYYGWLDFGGSTGIRRTVRRPFRQDGRYIYPAFSDNRARVQEAMVNAIVTVARQAGLEVDE